MPTRLGEFLAEALEARKWSMGILAMRAGVTTAAISKIISGKTETPTVPVLHKLADALSVDRECIMGLVGEASADAPPRKVDINYFFGKAGERRAQPVIHDGIKLHPVQAVGTIRAGEPVLAVEEALEVIPFPEELLPTGELFFVGVVGDSMIDERIFDGDLALFQRADTVDDYTIAAVLVNEEEVTIKKVHYTDQHIALLPANTGYRGTIHRENEVRVLGRFLYAIRLPRNGAR